MAWILTCCQTAKQDEGFHAAKRAYGGLGVLGSICGSALLAPRIELESKYSQQYTIS